MTLNLDIADFLANSWQKKPCLIKQGFAAFSDLISPEILAGLAMEEGADSRIVQTNANTESGWQVIHGPFEEYESFGESDWTLLVQSVNEWVPEVGELLQPFRFLPDWRLDDVMVSFSCENGGVGPHVDQYDVFIIQGAGKRRWRVGNRQPLQELQPTEDLCLVNNDFNVVIDEELESGDVLYIPAGCPHDGIALEPSLNYSVGFRAPSQAELLWQLGDSAMANDVLTKRYTDPDSQAPSSGYEITEQQLDAVKSLLIEAISSDESSDLIARLLSQSKRPLVEPELPVTAEQIPAMLEQGAAFIERAPGARLLRLNNDIFYLNGEKLEVPEAAQQAATQLAKMHGSAHVTELKATFSTPESQAFLAEVINLGGYYFFIDEAPE
jgi:50S ribosomal protein L16 3-hydroxylase